MQRSDDDSFYQAAWTKGNHPDAIAAVLTRTAAGALKIGIETGPMTVWLWHALTALGLPIVCLHARHAAAALKLQMNKTDRNDAFGLARLVRSGWYRPVAVRLMETHRLRALLITRDQLVGMDTAPVNKIRGLAKTFGILIGSGKGGTFERQVRATLPDNLVVAALFESLLAMLPCPRNVAAYRIDHARIRPIEAIQGFARGELEPSAVTALRVAA